MAVSRRKRRVTARAAHGRRQVLGVTLVALSILVLAARGAGAHDGGADGNGRRADHGGQCVEDCGGAQPASATTPHAPVAPPGARRVPTGSPTSAKGATFASHTAGLPVGRSSALISPARAHSVVVAPPAPHDAVAGTTPTSVAPVTRSIGQASRPRSVASVHRSSGGRGLLALVVVAAACALLALLIAGGVVSRARLGRFE